MGEKILYVLYFDILRKFCKKVRCKFVEKKQRAEALGGYRVILNSPSNLTRIQKELDG